MQKKITTKDVKHGIVFQAVSLGLLGVALGTEYYKNIFARGLEKVEGEVIQEEIIKSRLSTIELPRKERKIVVQWEQEGELFTKTFTDQEEQYQLGDSFTLWASQNTLGYAIEYRDKHKSTALKVGSVVCGSLAIMSTLNVLSKNRRS